MPIKDLRRAIGKSKYPLQAFLFVQRGLDYTVRRMHGEFEPAEVVTEAHAARESRHVAGQDLCLGLRDYAIEQYGLLARTVLRRWRIESSEDFGHIVFKMVDAGLMYKTEEDSIEDFIDVFDFATAFNPELSLTENA